MTVLVAFALLCCVGALVLHAWIRERAPIDKIYWADYALAIFWPIAGLLVLRSRPRAPAGWILVSAASMGPYLCLANYAAASALLTQHPLPGAGVAAWVSMWGFVAYLYTIPLVVMTFPDGFGSSRAWHRVIAAVLLASTVTVGSRMLVDVPADISPFVRNPLGMDIGWLKYVTLFASAVALVGGTVAGTISMVLRLRAATGERRLQLQWLALGCLILVAGILLSVFPAAFGLRSPGEEPGIWSDLAITLGLLGPPAGIAVATIRYRLFDVEVVLERSIVLLASSIIVVVAYLALVVGVGQLVAPASSWSLLLIAAVALAAALARLVIQRGLRRMLFGLGSDPYEVVARVGRHVAAASEPIEGLQRLAEALQLALKLPYVGFENTDGTISVAAGTPLSAGIHRVPANALGRQVGQLVVGRRSPRDVPTGQEQAALLEVAAQAGTLAYAAGLVGDVAVSRERIVLAREEERRRLRADLHDGVGPALAGTAHQIDALARKLEAAEQTQLAGRAREIRDRLRATVGDVRAVVRGLRPPILDQLGLERSLFELAVGYDTPAFEVDVAGKLGRLPAAVEVAGYQIAAEAVTNAVRHSAAARVRLAARTADGWLVVEVLDNGRGMPARPVAGFGLRSMSERAAEVGGRLEFSTSPGGGTTVRAWLPSKSQPSVHLSEETE